MKKCTASANVSLSDQDGAHEIHKLWQLKFKVHLSTFIIEFHRDLLTWRFYKQVGVQP